MKFYQNINVQIKKPQIKLYVEKFELHIVGTMCEKYSEQSNNPIQYEPND